MTFKLTYYDIQTILLGQSHLRQTRVCLRWPAARARGARCAILPGAPAREDTKDRSDVIDAGAAAAARVRCTPAHAGRA